MAVVRIYSLCDVYGLIEGDVADVDNSGEFAALIARGLWVIIAVVPGAPTETWKLLRPGGGGVTGPFPVGAVSSVDIGFGPQIGDVRVPVNAAAGLPALRTLDGSPGSAMPYDLHQQLRAWAEARAYTLASVTYHVTYSRAIASASVRWPDGASGSLTGIAFNATFGTTDAYTVTHVPSGLTVTQAAVTRNGAGLVTSQPDLVVA